MKPHPITISLLTRVEDVIPKWKIVPTKDVIDSAFKDPVKREQVSVKLPEFDIFLDIVLWYNYERHGIFTQIRGNKLIYQEKPRLKTALELLRTSMNLEDSLNEVSPILIQLFFSFISRARFVVFYYYRCC